MKHESNWSPKLVCGLQNILNSWCTYLNKNNLYSILEEYH